MRIKAHVYAAGAKPAPESLEDGDVTIEIVKIMDGEYVHCQYPTMIKEHQATDSEVLAQKMAAALKGQYGVNATIKTMPAIEVGAQFILEVTNG